MLCLSPRVFQCLWRLSIHDMSNGLDVMTGKKWHHRLKRSAPLPMLSGQRCITLL